ncbi:hypothetical protein IFO69_20910 [Echinicola sp. CAU 1574]|uniref:Lipoprotein n=1 Tax=Echinicola arenosa TaxID=2774144 RepID=A0ABR9AR25_9BACT|nr:hypothetical protein [Echinicola arenosa]MBD8491227.1 hypothetical protein [Echinicola arenosa]
MISKLFPIVLILSTISACSSPGNGSINSTTHIHQVISEEDLPKSISNNLKNNLAFSDLELIEVTKSRSFGDPIYDLKFMDEGHFIIRAKFDHEGRLVPYETVNLKIAQPQKQYFSIFY